MAKKKREEGKEKTVQISGVDVPQSALDAIPAGKTFTVVPANLIWSSERVYKQTEQDGPFTVVNWVDKPTEEDKEGKPRFGEPVEVVQIGMRTIQLPDAERQKKGFYHPDAKLLRRVVGGLKEFKPKGKV